MFKQWIGDKYLEKIKAEEVVYSGDTAAMNDSIKLLSDTIGKYYINMTSDTVLIEFDKCDKGQYKLDENINMKIDVRNINELFVKIFEINTRSYFRDKRSELNTDSNLDGLNVSHEWTVNMKELDLNNTFTRNKFRLNGQKNSKIDVLEI